MLCFLNITKKHFKSRSRSCCKMSEVSSSASSQPYKRRGYFNPGASKRKRFVLEPGMKGFLCSCNFKEKECIRESYNILNRYYDKHNEEVASTENKTDENEEEVEDELLREVEGLKSEVSSGFKHRFQVGFISVC